MENITINELQLMEVKAIIKVAEENLQSIRESSYAADNWDLVLYYSQKIDEKEHMLNMAYSILRALGLEYDADTHEITKREVVEEDED